MPDPVGTPPVDEPKPSANEPPKAGEFDELKEDNKTLRTRILEMEKRQTKIDEAMTKLFDPTASPAAVKSSFFEACRGFVGWYNENAPKIGDADGKA